MSAVGLCTDAMRTGRVMRKPTAIAHAGSVSDVVWGRLMAAAAAARSNEEDDNEQQQQQQQEQQEQQQGGLVEVLTEV